MYPADLFAITERLFMEPELVKKFDFNSNSGTSVSGDSVKNILIFQAKYIYCKLNHSINDDLHLCLGQEIKKEWTEYISPGWRRRIVYMSKKESKKSKKSKKQKQK